MRLRHNRVELALHELRSGEGPVLLLLHGLGEASPAALPDRLGSWTGPVRALDFTGHGRSSVPAGGGYTCEILMGDVDVALAHTGPATLLGRGLGAYVALLAAGGRPQMVHGAILDDGPGLAGGGPVPASPRILMLPAASGVGVPDPFALAELSADIRPPDYAAGFVRQATHLSGLADPVVVCARIRPPWLEAVVGEPGVVEAPLEQALEMFARSD
ncbi:MAG: alpha/beta fold hydrolase [Acidimicrobiales bacterium]